MNKDLVKASGLALMEEHSCDHRDLRTHAGRPSELGLY
jgi:hypothetical protein